MIFTQRTLDLLALAGALGLIFFGAAVIAAIIGTWLADRLDEYFAGRRYERSKDKWRSL